MMGGNSVYIGQPVISATAYGIPYFSSTGLLAQDPTKFKYNGSYFSLHGDGTGTASALFHVLGTTTSHIGKFDIGLDFNQVTTPTAAMSLALIASAGNIDVGTHFYRYTFVTAVGETALNNGTGATTTSITTDAGNAQVTVTLPVSTDYRVTAVNIYRATTNQPYYITVKKVGQVANGVTTFVDNISDASRTGVDSYSRPNTTNRFVTVNGSAGMMIDPLNALFGYRTGESVLAGTAAGGENAIFGSSSGISLIGGKNAVLGQYIVVGSSDSSTLIGHTAGGIGANYQSCIIMGRNASFWNSYSIGSIILNGAKGSTYYTAHYLTSIGTDALNSISTGAANLTALGYNAGYNVTSSVGSLVMGAFVNLPSATTNGQFNAGNVLYGLGFWTGASSGLAGVLRSATPTSGAQIGIGIVPTAGLARFEVVAGSTTYVPFKLNSGPLRATPVAGGIEFLTDTYYGTITTGAERRTFAMLQTAQTWTAIQRFNAYVGINVAPAYPLDVQGAINSQSVAGAAPNYDNITHCNFVADNPYNGYPAGRFLIGQNASDVNVTLLVGPLFATGATNKPSAIVVSTNASGVEATSYQTYLQQSTTLSQIITLNRSGATGAGAGTPFAISIGTGTSYSEAIRFAANRHVLIGTTTDTSFAQTKIVSGSGVEPLAMMCSVNTGYAFLHMLTYTGADAAGFGYSNASASYHADRCYFYTVSKEFFVSTDNTVTRQFKVDTSGRVGIGMDTTALTAVCHIGAGTTAKASITLTAGTQKTTPAAGDFEFINAEDGLTFTAVATRRKVILDTATQTLTNKAVVNRIGTTASSATPTPNADSHDQYNVTALAVGATFGAPTGTPTDGQNLVIRVKDNGTAQSLAFNAIYRFSTDLVAPVTTIISKTMYLAFKFNAADTKWDCYMILNNF